MTHHLGPYELLEFYRQGVFPMAESRDDNQIFLIDPDMRGIIPLDGLHVSRSLKKFMRKMSFTVTLDWAFTDVISLCAEETQTRDNTWINSMIERLYAQLYEIGHAHSVEVWDGDALVGGLYGVSINGAFFGESMFSRKTNASKVALVGLVQHLNTSGFALLDTQFITEHLKTLGAIEITREQYRARLDLALNKDVRFLEASEPLTLTVPIVKAGPNQPPTGAA